LGEVHFRNEIIIEKLPFNFSLNDVLLYKNNLYFPTYPGSKDSHDGAGDVAQVVEYLPRDVKP
jgi:hypothetical protein